MDKTKNNALGSLVISKDVISTIAYGAAKEVSGVKDVLPTIVDIKGIMTKRKVFVPVAVSIKDNIASIEIKVVLSDKVRVPNVCEKIQIAVKEAVQSMTEIAVSSVNIIVSGISFDTTIA
ncbi:MAG: Asp23/Gls24 family envelope stress response protein [Oscillospiraceae bacterium]